MKEKNKKILLWCALIFFILGFLNTIIEITNFASFRAESEIEGIELAFPWLTVALNIIWLLLSGWLIIVIYKKLFPKKEIKERIEIPEGLEKNRKDLFGGSFLSKVLFAFHFFVLIFAITQFIIGNWKLGISGVVLAIIVVCVAYWLSGGRKNPAILEYQKAPGQKTLELKLKSIC